MTLEWVEDDLQPRTDRLSKNVRPWSRRLRPEHPERFRAGDLLRFMDTAEVVWLKDDTFRMRRAVGTMNRWRTSKQGETVLIIGNGRATKTGVQLG